jgi:hypothetical protein
VLLVPAFLPAIAQLLQVNRQSVCASSLVVLRVSDVAPFVPGESALLRLCLHFGVGEFSDGLRQMVFGDHLLAAQHRCFGRILILLKNRQIPIDFFARSPLPLPRVSERRVHVFIQAKTTLTSRLRPAFERRDR